MSAGFAASFVPEVALTSIPPGVEVLDVPEFALSRSLYALVAKTGGDHDVDVYLDVLREVPDGHRQALHAEP